MNIPNVFNKSMYFCVRGSIIETKEDHGADARSTVDGDIACQAEWIADYTGKVYKNRLPTTDHIKEFLQSDRTPDFDATKFTMVEIITLVKVITKSVKNFAIYQKKIQN